ncbi:Transposon Tn7 transposition protein tnsB [Chromobacterium violaceum]|uniref:Transposon Tn7 transposition protein tnsB n=1 Tax=Chromobacterium violaceum TaxID=536 RepID=A0A3S4LHY3_CHRVL|nr:Transposon Tn7 transposition protein tnsB [Chromobacterium violaceum]
MLDNTQSFSRPQEVVPIAAQVAKRIGDARPPSTVSIYRWCRLFLNNSEDLMSLAPRTANCGRHQGRIAPEVLDLFYGTVDGFYLTRARLSKRDAHAELVDRITEENRLRPLDAKLRAVSYSCFCRLINRLLDPFILKARRFGEKYAHRYFRTRRNGPIALFPLERVEIDHTRLDIIVVHPITKQPLKRPTCTIALDRRTRMVCGIYIDLEPPSTIAVLMCLRQAVTSKQSILDSLPNGNLFTWPVEGQFRLLCMDNGPEFHGNAHKQFCSDMHADMQYCPPGKPWYKASVERFLGTLNLRLIHRLPGTTWSNTVERGDYPSEKLAHLTLHELRQLVYRWVVTEYHNTRHSELGETPLECWTRLVAEHPIPPLPSGLTLEAETGLTFERVISNGRIGTKGLVYHHPYLIHLQARLPAKQKIMLRIDPEDITQAYIYDPINKALIRLECLTQGLEPDTSWLDFQRDRKGRIAQSDTVEGSAPDTNTVRQEKAKLRREVHQLHQDAEHNLTQRTRKRTKSKKRDLTGSCQKPHRSTTSSSAYPEESLGDDWFIDRPPATEEAP